MRCDLNFCDVYLPAQRLKLSFGDHWDLAGSMCDQTSLDVKRHSQTLEVES